MTASIIARLRHATGAEARQGGELLITTARIISPIKMPALETSLAAKAFRRQNAALTYREIAIPAARVTGQHDDTKLPLTTMRAMPPRRCRREKEEEVISTPPLLCSLTSSAMRHVAIDAIVHAAPPPTQHRLPLMHRDTYYDRCFIADFQECTLFYNTGQSRKMPTVPSRRSVDRDD